MSNIQRISETSREKIMARLKAAPKRVIPELPVWNPPTYAPQDRLAQWSKMMDAFRGEIINVTEENWVEGLAKVLADKGIKRMTYGAKGPEGAKIEAGLANSGVELVPYNQSIEEFKAELVNDIEAGFTSTIGGIAETGSLALWPTKDEPRLLSLLPHIHIALLRASTIVDNFPTLMRSQNWAAQMPTNALLISGPSKTADIEQTLAFGVHGPKQLVILVIND